MRRRAFFCLSGAGLVGLLQTPVLAGARDEIVKMAMTDSILPGVSGKLLAVVARPFKSLVESGMGMRGQIVESAETCVLAKQLKEDKVQLGLFQGIEFAWARQVNPKLQPIVICVNQERTLKAYLVIRAASSFRQPADLHGQTLALPAETRPHCKAFLRHKCVGRRAKLSKFFGKIEKTDDVEEALDDVVDNTAQAAVVDGLAWSSYRQAKPGAAKRLRVLLASEPFPATVVACQKGRFADSVVERFRKYLIDAKKGGRGRLLLAFLNLSHCEAVPDNYASLCDRIVKAYPPPR